MAGLDRKRGADFIAMLQEIGGKGGESGTTSDPVTLCTTIIQTMQMATNTLLLRERDMPLSIQSFSGCCDTLVAKRKVLSIAVQDCVAGLQSKDAAGMCVALAKINEAVCIVTETTAQAVFTFGERTPGSTKSKAGAVDGYLLARGRLAITVATSRFGKPNIHTSEVMSIAAVVATHLDILRDQCNKAKEKLEATAPKQSTIFDALARGLSGNAAVLVAAIKALVADQSEHNRQTAQILAKPLLTAVDSLIEFASANPAFAGIPSTLQPQAADIVKPIQAAAMSVGSASTLFLTAVKAKLSNPGDAAAPAAVARYTNAVDEALGALVQTLRIARDSSMMA